MINCQAFNFEKDCTMLFMSNGDRLPDLLEPYLNKPRLRLKRRFEGPGKQRKGSAS